MLGEEASYTCRSLKVPFQSPATVPSASPSALLEHSSLPGCFCPTGRLVPSQHLQSCLPLRWSSVLSPSARPLQRQRPCVVLCPLLPTQTCPVLSFQLPPVCPGRPQSLVLTCFSARQSGLPTTWSVFTALKLTWVLESFSLRAQPAFPQGNCCLGI